jgi:peptidoglycan/LPS O-acetylase OafA/YrhL
LTVGFHVWLGSTPWSLLAYTLPGTFYLFAVGMAVAVLDVQADALRVVSRWIRYPAAFWGVAALLYVVVSMKVPSAALGSVHPLYAVVSLLVFLPAVLGSRVASVVLGWRPMAGLGLVSYAFYLWHQAVIEQWMRLSSLPTWLLGVLSMATVLAISVISYFLVERPVLRAVRHRARITPRTPATVHPVGHGRDHAVPRVVLNQAGESRPDVADQASAYERNGKH